MKTVLLLEDNEDRIAGFQKAVASLGPDFELKVWRDAPTMCSECQEFFSTAALISLDHDLNPPAGVAADPGTGMDVARFLSDFLPVCPVLIHSSNTDRVWSMHNELRFAGGWILDQVGPLGTDWIETSWARRARELLAEHPNTWKAELPKDHQERVQRMSLSLDGLGLGDALGEMFSYRAEITPVLMKGSICAGPWFHTDDTEMAISIAAVLKSHGQVHQDALARRFARRFERDPDRGYGKMTRIQMREILAGANWKHTAARAFGGQGSMGNGSAMRVAPLGAYFADDLDRCASEARASSEVTHTHLEGIAGAVAVALAATMAWRLKGARQSSGASEFFAEIVRLTPESEVRRKVLLASEMPASTPVRAVAQTLGNGTLVTAPDTVPFCLWTAAHRLDNFVEALAETISVGGDCDTNAAIVGGIVALAAGREGIPADWLTAREPIRL